MLRSKLFGLVALFVFGAGCFQLTGVSDFKVEEACVLQPGATCRVAPNCGCPATQTCELAGVNGEGACQASGAVASGGSCTASSECATGLGCINNTCTNYCRNDNDCPDKQCDALTTGTGTPIVGVGSCNTPCDPAAPYCADGRACRFLQTERTGCFPAGAGADGSACTNDGECGAGLVCVPGNVCSPLCQAGSTCASGVACQAVAFTYKGTTYGFCPAPK